jgi:predicted RNA methylase
LARISEQVLAILSRCDVKENIILLTCGQLDRKEYLAVNAVLESMGGKWNRKEKGHVFTSNPVGKFESVLLTGEIDKPEDFGFFPTPAPLARRVVELARIDARHSVLEPSAGDGALADEVRRVCPGVALLDCVELLPDNCAILSSKGYHTEQADFLSWSSPTLFDRVVMNPPFARQADIDHVTKAWSHVRPGGRLVAIMSAGVIFRENKKTTQFRELLDAHGCHERNQDGAFKESGTMVNTVTVTMDKPPIAG